MQQVFEIVESLELEKRLLPTKNPDITWFYVFLPALICYIAILSNHVHHKPTIGYIEVINAQKMATIFGTSAAIQQVYLGNRSIQSWHEGPLWIDSEDGLGYLLFSNTIQNRIDRWEEGKGLFTVGKTTHAERSGCYINSTFCSTLYEGGSNGLLRLPAAYLSPKAPDAVDLLVCQHGERAIGVLKESRLRSFVATHFLGRRFNSPNDIVMTPEGHIYFTDPTYGLVSKENGSTVKQELPWSGIYFINNTALAKSLSTGVPTTTVKLVHKDMTRPNGLAFSPDFSKLYVSNSDPSNAYWRVFHVQENGNLKIGEILFNATAFMHNRTIATDSTTASFNTSNNDCNNETWRTDEKGNPDGLKVDVFGNVFATGPGGVWVFSEEGELLGRLRMDGPVTNVAFGDKWLYFTTPHAIARVHIKTKPVKLLSKITRKS